MTRKVLIVGAGIAGLTASIALARKGIVCQVAEISPSRHALGTAITITGPAIATIEIVGVLDDCKRLGHPGCLTGNIYDAGGRQIGDPPPGEAILPSVDMYRPVLSELLTRQALNLGVDMNSAMEPKAATIS